LRAQVRTTLGPRLTKMFPSLDGEAFKISLAGIARGLRKLGANEGSDMLSPLGDAASFARRALPSDDSSFIWSELSSGITDNAEKTLQSLYERFVSQYDEKQKAARDDAAVWRPVRDRLLERQIADRLQPKTISSPIDTVEFEHAWKNGAWHCYQPLSFDLSTSANIREKAARWTGHMVALAGASEPFKAHFFVGAPSDPQLRDAYDQALEILKLGPSRPEVIEESEMDALVDRIEDEIRSHEHPIAAG
jgi:hypothetical protein